MQCWRVLLGQCRHMYKYEFLPFFLRHPEACSRGLTRKQKTELSHNPLIEPWKARLHSVQVLLGPWDSYLEYCFSPAHIAAYPLPSSLVPLVQWYRSSSDRKCIYER